MKKSFDYQKLKQLLASNAIEVSSVKQIYHALGLQRAGRGGRTTKMIVEIIDYLSEEKNNSVLLVAHTMHYAKDLEIQINNCCQKLRIKPNIVLGSSANSDRLEKCLEGRRNTKIFVDYHVVEMFLSDRLNKLRWLKRFLRLLYILELVPHRAKLFLFKVVVSLGIALLEFALDQRTVNLIEYGF